jgi:hypothetical protein
MYSMETVILHQTIITSHDGVYDSKEINVDTEFREDRPIRPLNFHLLLSYGCETWSLIQREEHTLKVFEKRVLREIFDLGDKQ